MKRKRKYYLTLLLFLCLVPYYSISQQVVVTLNQTESGIINHVASEKISFLPGYSYTPGFANFGYEKMHAYIDQNQVFPANYLSQAPSAQSRVLDYSLPVGSLPGSVSVSQSGAANYSIPLEVPPGTNGMQPDLSINYNSQGGNGILGVKWQLGGISAISRVPRDIIHDGYVRGVQFNSLDKFSLDGNRLVVKGTDMYGGNGSYYHTELETFKEIISYTSSGIGVTNFQVITKDGNIIEYGNSNDSRIEAEGRDEVIIWLMNKVTDRFGNSMEYFYYENNGQGEYRIDRIEYTKNTANGIISHYNTVKFYYDERIDKEVSYVKESKQENSKLLRKIDTYCEGSLVYSYKFSYHYDFYSHLTEVVKQANDNLHTNSTIFEWGESSSSFNVYPNPLLATYEDVIISDFSGDGHGDAFCKVNASNWELYKWNPLSESFSILSSGTNLPENIMQMLPGDFNGDGLNDLLITYQNSVDNWVYMAIFFGNGIGFSQVYLNQGVSFSFGPLFRCGDFNADGKTDIFRVHDEGAHYKCLLWEYDISTDLLNEMASQLVDPFEKMYVRDFNGDRRDDFLFVEDNSSSLRSYFGSSPYLSEFGSLTYPTDLHDIFPGDFNGDGISDILTYKDSEWKIGICDGNSFQFNIIPHPPILDYNIFLDPPEDEKYIVIDMNGDGRDDIFESQEISFNIHLKSVYLFDGDTWIQEQETYNYPATDISDSKFSDINGDGSIDLFCKTSTSDNFGVISFHPNEEKHLVKYISNGLDVKSEIVYEPLTNNEVYSKGNGATYPLADIVMPLLVVHKLKNENPIGDFNTTEYFYSDGKMHKQGRGFIGFAEIQSKDLASGLIQTNVFSINEDWYYPYKIYTKNELSGSPTVLLSDLTINNTQFKEFQSVFNVNSFLPLIVESQDNDYDKGVTKMNIISYDGYANIISNSTTVLNNNSVEWQYTSSFMNFINTGSFYPNKPQSVLSTSNNMLIADNHISQTNYTYNSLGLVETICNNPSNPLQENTIIIYNNLGNIISSTKIASGMSNRENQFIYDEKGRFVISHTNPKGHLSEYSYDYKYGIEMKSVDPNGNIILSEYNSLGQKIKQTLPTGQEELFETNWINNGNVLTGIYSISNNLAGFGEQKSIYNKVGQVLKTRKPGYNGLLDEDIVYNNLGQVILKSKPYYIGQTPVWDSFVYGSRGELLEENSQLNNYSYSYNNLTATKTETNLALSTSVTTNSVGMTVHVNDLQSNDIDYSYNNQGLNDGVVINNNVSTNISKEYDLNGNVIMISDPDIGVSSFSFNPFNELISQTDANGIQYNFEYDKLGRILSRSNSNAEETTYQYDNYPNGIGLISYINFNNLIEESYVYDDYSRLISCSENNDGVIFSKDYSYNIYNQLISESYPSGFYVNYTYNTNGFLNHITKNDGSLLWSCNSINKFGMITDFNLGNNFNTQIEYTNDGVLSAIETFDQNLDNIQDLNYIFSQNTGNLQSRADLTKSVFEDFTYDASKSKLTSSDVGPYTAELYSYDALGNIMSKSHTGNYTYDQNKIHAVSGVTGNFGTIPSFLQSIAYNDFNKVESIIENNKKIEFEYGHDRQRRKTQLYDNNVLQKTKYYLGNYEKEINELTGEVKEFHYLSSPSGIYAVLTKTSGQPDNIRYLHKDYLGSLQSISDESGNIVEEYSFDAWGRQRDPDYWSYNNPPNLPDFNRGYTGHEHLQDFGLINMNGRLYDPVLGRMLSPDKYIQSPNNSQSYNRYSYCLNNPVKYRDPSGELFLIDDLIVGGISFIGGYAYEGLTTGDWGWNSVANGAMWSATSLIALNTCGLSLSPTAAASFGGQMIASNIFSDISPSLSIPFGSSATITISPTLVFGSNQTGLGISTSFTGHFGDINITTGVVASGFLKNFGPSGTSTEFLEFWSNGYDDGDFGLSYTTSSYSSGETSQILGSIRVRKGDFSLSYQNDYMFGLPADGGDRYRTAAALFSWKDFSAGVNLFTGDPGLNEKDRLSAPGVGKYHEGKEVYYSGTSNKYRAGIAYIGYKNTKIGMNSEKIRHYAQNRFAHDFISKGRAKHFQVLNINPTGYFSIGTKSLYTLW